ncbi:ParB N-terminal domain-containing protein [Mycobacterium asiaticum]|uniref:DNA sulfur modification protein DndB n=1 Tax=Mycobacterium asiaticum TaxID=1790 RepID=UPI00056D2090|nr:DNA sulfur modification protein DndB [Mycobacterium asiaticum]ORA16399.1 hypothetical protein BST16_06765 [Mycobacterium asiaticum DSM 44297]
MSIQTEIDTTAVVKNVHDYVDMPGIGRIYRAVIPVSMLARLLKRSVVRYAPEYQRGFKKVQDDPNTYSVLLPLTDPTLQVSRHRAEEMAVKYLRGDLFSGTVIWNARIEEDDPAPEYDPTTEELRLFGDIVIPDTAHRHLAYYLLTEWKRDEKTIPTRVTVNDVPVEKNEIQKMLIDFDPKKASLFLEIYSLSPEKEGWLYDQFNFDARPPQKAVGNTLNPTKTPARRFVLGGLMRVSPVFGDKEVEMRANNIGSDSRKLVTNNTLISAADNFKKLLVNLEKENEKTGAYDDFLAFFAAFFNEYANHFPAAKAGATQEVRQEARAKTFAVSNIMFHPLFRLAKDLWISYRAQKQDWKTRTEWKDAIARLAGTVEVTEKDKVTGKDKKVKYGFMSRNNPQWVGKILIEQYGPAGVTGTSLSNTRQTRETAYSYLVEQAKVGPFIDKGTAK